MIIEAKEKLVYTEPKREYRWKAEFISFLVGFGLGSFNIIYFFLK